MVRATQIQLQPPQQATVKREPHTLQAHKLLSQQCGPMLAQHRKQLSPPRLSACEAFSPEALRSSSRHMRSIREGREAPCTGGSFVPPESTALGALPPGEPPAQLPCALLLSGPSAPAHSLSQSQHRGWFWMPMVAFWGAAVLCGQLEASMSIPGLAARGSGSAGGLIQLPALWGGCGPERHVQD